MNTKNGIYRKITAIFLAGLIVFSFSGCSEKTNDASATNTAITENTNETAGSDRFDADEYYSRLEHCVEQIRERTDFVPDIILVLGSGLGHFADNLEVEAEIPYSDIEGFPESTVEGHEGKLIFGTYKGKKIVAMKGRVHYYEGYDMYEVVLPLRVLHLLGADTVILTHAVGAINADYAVGDLVITKDHISSFVPSPLIGENIDELGERFTDMTDVYDKELSDIARKVADENGITVHTGVFIQVTGPQFETPAEIEMYRSLGADTVGMSTVVEVIAARHMGMRIFDIAQVTNMAAGMEDVELSHEDIQKASEKTADSFTTLISGLLEEMPDK